MTQRTWWHVGLKPFLQMLATVAALALAVQVVWGVGGAALYRAVTGADSTPGWWDAAAVVLALAAYAAAVRLTQRRSVSELAPRPALGELAAGAGLGAALITAVMGILVAAGAYHLSAGAGPASVGPALTIAVLTGFVEELVIRGAVMTWLVAWTGGWGALALSSLIFGALHLANPGATLGGALAIAGEAGLLLGAALFLTGRLWLAIGVHLGWNFTEAGVFGVRLSGNDIDGSIWNATPVAGRELLSGGAFGAEASPVAVLVCLALAVPMLVVAARRGRIPGPAWGTRTGRLRLLEETPGRVSR